MARDLDAMLKRFDDRNADKLEAEAKEARFDKTVLFNAQELLFRAIAGAAFIACDRLGVERDRAHGELVPNEAEKKWEVRLVITDRAVIEKHGDSEIQRIMRDEFSKASALLVVEKEAQAALDSRFAEAEPIEHLDAYFERWRALDVTAVVSP